MNKDKVAEAWEKLYIAEGSDWCWWFGEEHNSGMDDKFDELFRSQLMGVYKILGKRGAGALQDTVVEGERASKLTRELVAFLKPVIDGKVTSYYEWLPAGIYDTRATGGAMHQVDNILYGIYYGFDLNNLFIRLDSWINLISTSELNGLTFNIQIIKPNVSRIEISVPQPGKVFAVQFEKGEKGHWRKVRDIKDVAAEEIIEIAIPFDSINASINEEVQLVVVVSRGEEELERWPKSGYLSFDVPTEEFDVQ